MGLLKRSKPPAEPKRQIALDDTGFAILEGGAETAHIAFDDIATVAAYKVDLFTTDEIRFEIEHARDHLWYTVTEEDAGFAELDAAFARELPGYVADWYPRIVKPAFATNWIRIFHRPDATEPAPD